MNHGLGILSNGVKITLHLVYLWPTLSFKSKMPQKLSVIFDFSLLEWKVVKNVCAIFDYVFTFGDIGLCYSFFLLELVLKLEILHNIRNRRHSFAQQLFPQMYTSFKGITWKIFWVRARTLMLTENPFRRLIAFHCYCNFNPLAILNDVWYLWNAWYFS